MVVSIGFSMLIGFSPYKASNLGIPSIYGNPQMGLDSFTDFTSGLVEVLPGLAFPGGLTSGAQRKNSESIENR